VHAALASQVAGMYVHDTDPTYPDQCVIDLVVNWRGDPDIVIAVTYVLGPLLAG
jgi:hypothetical protein